MVKTNDIVRGKQNKVFLVDVKEILTWYPGDYIHLCGKCDLQSPYHTCISIEIQWQYVLNNIIYADEIHYAEVYRSVITHGIVGALRAKVTENDHVVLLDGHNRVGVGLDLSLKALEVYVGDRNTDIDDLRAPDSGWWQGHQKPWSFNV